MKENDTIEMYFVKLLVGDEYHKEGEVFKIDKEYVKDIQARGLRLKIENPEFRDDVGVWHWYPVTIVKKTYRLDLIETQTVDGGDRSNRPGWEDEIKHESIDYGGGRYN